MNPSQVGQKRGRSPSGTGYGNAGYPSPSPLTSAASSSSRFQLPPTQQNPQGRNRQMVDLTVDDDDEEGDEEDDEDGEEEEALLATMNSKIVGTQHYPGSNRMASGQDVAFKRDPMNPYDRNAISVYHPGFSAQIGHIPRGTASKISPLLDRGSLTSLEGKAGRSSTYTTDLTLHLYGKPSLLRDPKFRFALPGEARINAAAAASGDVAGPAVQGMMGAGGAGGMDGAGGVPLAGAPGGYVDPRMARMNAMLADAQEKEREARSRADMLNQLFGDDKGEDLAKMPLWPVEVEGLKTKLLPYQSQGLRWMVRQEHPVLPVLEDEKKGKGGKATSAAAASKGKKGKGKASAVPGQLDVEDFRPSHSQLWVPRLDGQGKTYYYHLATRAVERDAQKLGKSLKKGRGGLLCDDMGLGKTVTALSLILTDDTGVEIGVKEELDETVDDMTLIVCPLSVLGNWKSQIEEHVDPNAIKYHVYHGSGRGVTKKELKKHDVVITTYQIVASELSAAASSSSTGGPAPKRQLKGLLGQIYWRRVILDEGHTIKNRKAKMSMGCSALMAERRWVLTGTPIVNAAADLGSMLQFLKLCVPLDEKSEWSKWVEKKLKHDPAEGGKVLRAIVQSTTLRRTKEMKDSLGKNLVQLPELKFYVVKVKLSQEAQILYDEVAKAVSEVFGKLVKEGNSSYTNALVFLLRLRQIACDPKLCPQSFLDEIRQRQSLGEGMGAGGGAANTGPITDKKILKGLRRTLKTLIEESSECPVCFCALTEARITPCRHVFCKDCILEALNNKPECPMDRGALYPPQLIELGDEAELQSDDENDNEEADANLKTSKPAISDKTQKLLQFLRNTEKGVKTLVFSQWTQHLDRIQDAFDSEGISYCRFDGAMTGKKREEVMKAFAKPCGDGGIEAGGDDESDEEMMIPGTRRNPKGKGKASNSSKGRGPTVMLISLKSGAVGLNLTAASQVVLLDPWWQSAIEHQAVDRVFRLGQTKPVRVLQLVAEGTVEDKVLDIQQKKEELISQAFSGLKSSTGGAPGESRGRQKIESRMADMAQLLGVRMDGGPQNRQGPGVGGSRG